MARRRSSTFENTTRAAGDFVRNVVTPWLRRLRWLRRGAVVGATALGVYTATRPRHEPSAAERGLGGSGGSAGVPAPVGGPPSPTPLRAVATPPDTDSSPQSTSNTAAPAARTTLAVDSTPGDARPRWVTDPGPDAPGGFPVKVNTGSGIYHVPGGLSYERTKAERWYESPEAAEADGFRAAKR